MQDSKREGSKMLRRFDANIAKSQMQRNRVVQTAQSTTSICFVLIR